MRALTLLFIFLLIPSAIAEVSDHPGFPVGFSVDISNAIAVADINNDTLPEIMVAPNSRSVHVYSSSGALLWKASAGDQTPAVTVSPLVADVNGDGTVEIVLAGGSFVPGTTNYVHKIYIFSGSGKLLAVHDLGSGYAPSAPAYADGLILVGLSGSYTGLYAYDAAGLRWQLPFAGGSERMNGIATGDLDGDGISEAVLAGGGKVTAVNVTVGSIKWQRDAPGAITPVIINSGGRKAVVVSGSSGTVALDSAGSQIWSSPVTARYYYDSYSSPAVADLNGDGSDDVIIVNDYSVYAISGADGSLLPGFPVSSAAYPPGSFRGRPAVYDMNGDLRHEIIAGDSNGDLSIWDSAGKMLEGFPVRITGRPKPMYSSPAVSDLEGDGIPEVVIGSSSSLHVISVKGKNIPPKAVISIPKNGSVFRSYEEIKLLSGSSDADGRIVSSIWHLDGSALCQGISCAVRLPVGRHNIVLEVADDRGAMSTASVDFRVNSPPVAVISGLKSVYNPWEQIRFTSGSFDPDGSIITHEWYVDGIMISGDVNFLRALDIGIHTVNLTVEDDAGEKGTTGLILRVNSPPLAKIDSPAAVLMQRDAVEVSGKGMDSDGSIVSYRWNSSLDGELSRDPVFSSSMLSVGEHRITLEVTDNDGASGVATIVLNQTGYDVEWQLPKNRFRPGSSVPIRFAIYENGTFVEDRTAVISVFSSAGEEVYRASFEDGSLRFEDDKYIANYHSDRNAYGAYVIKLGFSSKRPGQVFEKQIEASFNVVNALKHLMQFLFKLRGA